jgi:hypothetical protein
LVSPELKPDSAQLLATVIAALAVLPEVSPVALIA